MSPRLSEATRWALGIAFAFGGAYFLLGTKASALDLALLDYKFTARFTTADSMRMVSLADDISFKREVLAELRTLRAIACGEKHTDSGCKTP